MAQYHINPNTGNPGECRAEKSCPFGSPDEHHGSAEQARAVYETKMGSGVSNTALAHRDHAAWVSEELWNLREIANSYGGSTQEYHEDLAALSSDLADEAEQFSKRATDVNEAEAWARTANRARMDQADHERMAILLQPRIGRGPLSEYREALATAEAKCLATRDAWEDTLRVYRENPAEESELASQLHTEWARAREYEPRMKPDGDGGEVDIANTSFYDLPYKWQEENLLASRSALSAVRDESGNVELAAVRIHRDWLERNGSWAEPHQKLPYHQLSEEEKEKDRVLAREALRLIS